MQHLRASGQQNFHQKYQKNEYINSKKQSIRERMRSANLLEIVELEVTRGAIAVEGDLLRLGLGHGESLRVEP